MNYAQFTDFVNTEFERLGITDFVAYKTERTYPTQDQIEAGACRILVYFKPKNDRPVVNNMYLMCFDTLKYYNEQLKLGNSLYLKAPTEYLRDATIEVK